MTVEIRGDSVLVMYVRDETHELHERGEVMDRGQLVKHKSVEWIITIKVSDSELEEVGGCTGGPAIIDFKNKKY